MQCYQIAKRRSAILARRIFDLTSVYVFGAKYISEKEYKCTMLFKSLHI